MTSEHARKNYTAARIAAVQYVNLTYKAKCCEGYTEPAFLKIADQARHAAQRWLHTFNMKYAAIRSEHQLPERWGPQEFLEYDNKQPIK
jgi:hypothetical protein